MIITAKSAEDFAGDSQVQRGSAEGAMGQLFEQHLATSLCPGLPSLLLNLLQAAPLRCCCMLVLQVLLDLRGALALPMGRHQLGLHRR